MNNNPYNQPPAGYPNPQPAYPNQPQYPQSPYAQYPPQPQYPQDPYAQYPPQPEYGQDPYAQYGTPQYNQDPYAQYPPQPQYQQPQQYPQDPYAQHQQPQQYPRDPYAQHQQPPQYPQDPYAQYPPQPQYQQPQHTPQDPPQSQYEPQPQYPPQTQSEFPAPPKPREDFAPEPPDDFVLPFDSKREDEAEVESPYDLAEAENSIDRLLKDAEQLRAAAQIFKVEGDSVVELAPDVIEPFMPIDVDTKPPAEVSEPKPEDSDSAVEKFFDALKGQREAAERSPVDVFFETLTATPEGESAVKQPEPEPEPSFGELVGEASAVDAFFDAETAQTAQRDIEKVISGEPVDDAEPLGALEKDSGDGFVLGGLDIVREMEQREAQQTKPQDGGFAFGGLEEDFSEQPAEPETDSFFEPAEPLMPAAESEPAKALAPAEDIVESAEEDVREDAVFGSIDIGEIERLTKAVDETVGEARDTVLEAEKAAVERDDGEDIFSTLDAQFSHLNGDAPPDETVDATKPSAEPADDAGFNFASEISALLAATESKGVAAQRRATAVYDFEHPADDPEIKKEQREKQAAFNAVFSTAVYDILGERIPAVTPDPANNTKPETDPFFGRYRKAPQGQTAVDIHSLSSSLTHIDKNGVKTKIISGLNAKIPVGSVCAISGAKPFASHALLETLGGCVPFAEGRFSMCGEDVFPKEQVEMPSLFYFDGVDILGGDITVMDFLRYSLSAADAERVAAEFDMYNLLATKTTILTAAQKALLIAVAAAQSPVVELVIMNVPRLVFTPRERGTVRALFDYVRQSGKTLLFESCDRGFAMEYSDMLIAIENGGALYCGGVEDFCLKHSVILFKLKNPKEGLADELKRAFPRLGVAVGDDILTLSNPQRAEVDGSLLEALFTRMGVTQDNVLASPLLLADAWKEAVSDE